jgi:hypothetical protein
MLRRFTMLLPAGMNSGLVRSRLRVRHGSEAVEPSFIKEQKKSTVNKPLQLTILRIKKMSMRNLSGQNTLYALRVAFLAETPSRFEPVALFGSHLVGDSQSKIGHIGDPAPVL